MSLGWSYILSGRAQGAGVVRERFRVDVGVITILEAELGAVLDQFRECRRLVDRRRQYSVGRVHGRDVAIVRCLEQGCGEAQSVARDLIEDLKPLSLLVVGIAGGVPSSDYTLGDVVVSSRVLDFTVEAALDGGRRELASRGGPIHPDVGKIVANLRAAALGPWNAPESIGGARPALDPTQAELYGDSAWQKKLRTVLDAHFAGREARRPIKACLQRW